jgi:hypothetical protein
MRGPGDPADPPDPGAHEDEGGGHFDHEPDEHLDDLLHAVDLDGLVRLIDDRSATRDWPGLLRVRDRARQALTTGRQVWPAATLAEYRLALHGPPELVAVVLDEGDELAGRFTIGPLTEVAAQHHPWAALAPLLRPGPRAAIVAHERVLRGEDVGTPDLPGVIDVPWTLQPWEPAYALATYADHDAAFPVPDLPARWEPVAPRPGAERLDDDVDLAVRQLVQPWTTASNGRVDVVAVEGDRLDALGALGLRRARVGRVTAGEALAWVGWAGASGGAHGRRQGAAAGRFGAWWLLAALGDLLDDWPTPVDPLADELGALARELRWWRWDAHEPTGGWVLQLVVEDPHDGLAWAFSCRDDA